MTTDTWIKDSVAEGLIARAGELPEARALLDGARASEPLRTRGVTGSARALLTAWLARAAERPIVCVTPHGDGFESWRDDLEYFAGPGSLLAFPEPDTLPYDPSSPHPGITAQRLETLSRLAALRGSGRPLPVLAIGVGGSIDPDRAIERLVQLGYERLPEVEAMGQFARRGGILDIYPVGASDPLRLEFDGDTIVSLRRFDASTQRSIEQLPAATVLPRYEVVITPAEAGAVAERLRAAREGVAG